MVLDRLRVFLIPVWIVVPSIFVFKSYKAQWGMLMVVPSGCKLGPAHADLGFVQAGVSTQDEHVIVPIVLGAAQLSPLNIRKFVKNTAS